jgi:DNA-binding CsgD family transcriptional regulator
MSQVLPFLGQDKDTFLSQNEFKNGRRRVVDLLRINLCFVDLDQNRCPGSYGCPDSFFEVLCCWLDEYGPDFTIYPSAVIFSGRGYHLKWFFDSPIPSMALPRWNAIQKALVEQYKGLGADPQARDASRVLRVVGTKNSKSGEIARLIYPPPGFEPERYSFEFLAEEVLPFSRDEVQRMKDARAEREKERQARRDAFKTHKTAESLNWARVHDLRHLIGRRKLENGGAVPEGQRELFLFWMINFFMLSRATTPQLMYSEANALSVEIDPRWGYRSAELGTVYSKAVAAARGETVSYNGRTYPALYTPKNEYLINCFGITPDEMKGMRTIIDSGEAKRRKKIRNEDYRRKEGAVAREAYQATAQARKAQARELREKGLSCKEIGKELGVSASSVSGYIKGS